MAMQAVPHVLRIGIEEPLVCLGESSNQQRQQRRDAPSHGFSSVAAAISAVTGRLTQEQLTAYNDLQQSCFRSSLATACRLNRDMQARNTATRRDKPTAENDDGLVLKNSRGDKTAIEFSGRGVRAMRGSSADLAEALATIPS